MTNNIQTLPVIIRMRKDEDGRMPLAFFPTLPGTCEYDMVCYERIGQHSTACEDFVSSCVTPVHSDFAAVSDLLEEIRRIYETGDNAVKLIQRRRVHRHYFEIRKKNFKKAVD